MLTFYEQAKQGRIQELKASFETYLFAIGKNKVLNCIRREKRSQIELFLDSMAEYKTSDVQEVAFEQQEDAQSRRLHKALKNLSFKNRTLVMLRFFEGLSPSEIAERMQYSSENVANAALSRAFG